MDLLNPPRLALLSAVFLITPQFAHAEEATAPEPQGCSLPAKRLERLELIFGLEHVSSRAWTAFMQREVTSRFPDGLTIFDGYGQWRNKRGVINKERSRLLLIWYVRDTASEAKIEAIRSAYKRRFHQD